jgi:glycosyltransferase involved in cell wall biosynthesis
MVTFKEGYSVLIAVKNGSKYINYALKSVLEQTRPAKDIIVIDDNSTDSTRQDITRNFPTIKLIQATGHGQLKAFKEGLGFVGTEFVSFLDSDDCWNSTKQENQLGILEEMNHLDAVCSGVVNFLDNKEDPTDFSGSAKNFIQSRQFGASTFRTESLQNSFPLISSKSHFQWQMDWWINSINQGLKYDQTNELHLYRRIHKENSWSKSDQGKKELIEFIRMHKEKR